jgi:anti-anti-sigma factor
VAEEVLTNVAKYGHDDGAEHTATLQLGLTAGEIVLEFADDGRAFDPVTAAHPEPLPESERQPGGLGLVLIRSLVDSLHYTRRGAENVLVARKRLFPDSSSSMQGGRMALNIRVEDDRSLTKKVILDGRLDNETSADFDKHLDAVLAAPVRIVVLDLGKLEHITSAGLRSIFRVQKVMNARAGKAVLFNPQPQVQKVFDIVKAADVGAVFKSVRELDEYLDAIQKKIKAGE